jgi:hypothetical protein
MSGEQQLLNICQQILQPVVAGQGRREGQV